MTGGGLRGGPGKGCGHDPGAPGGSKEVHCSMCFLLLWEGHAVILYFRKIPSLALRERAVGDKKG